VFAPISKGLVNALATHIQNLDLRGSANGSSSYGSGRSPSLPVSIPSGVSLHLKRPIFPNLPYSPMSSPSNARRRLPLKQSRNVSIEKTGQYVQLNQYLLKEPIGQVIYSQFIDSLLKNSRDFIVLFCYRDLTVL